MTLFCMLQIAGFLCGCKLAITVLLEKLHDSESSFTKEALRNCIIDLATRRSFAPCKGKISILQNVELACKALHLSM